MSKFYQKKYVSKYTGKEIDEAVAKAADAFENPMTSAGDIIVGGEDGAAERLAKGTDGKVLKMVSGAPAWADDSSGMLNPMTTAGDLIVGGEDGAAGRLAKGTDGQVLSMVSGAPAWAAGSTPHLYAHYIRFGGSVTGYTDINAYMMILRPDDTQLTFDQVKSLLAIDTFIRPYIATGYAKKTSDQTCISGAVIYADTDNGLRLGIVDGVTVIKLNSLQTQGNSYTIKQIF